MTGAGSSLALVLLIGMGCAAVATDRVSGDSGPLVPIRDRYARARLELLAAINEDRRAAGLQPVRLDSLTTVVSQAHAEAMATEGFFSHYGLTGDTPYVRLAEAGGTGHVSENVFRWQERAGNPRDAGDPWQGFDVWLVQRSLMGSTGHRATILDPHRTHVGLGIASDPGRREVVVVQDFVARHAELDVPRQAWRRSRTPLEGRLLDRGLRPLLILLRRELDQPPRVVGDGPPPGPYPDGRGEARLVPPWTIAWWHGPASFQVDLGPILAQPGRWYGVVYVAPRLVVERAIARSAATTEQGWPGAAFVIDVL